MFAGCAQAMQKYKQASGIDVDPAIQQEAQVSCSNNACDVATTPGFGCYCSEYGSCSSAITCELWRVPNLPRLAKSFDSNLPLLSGAQARFDEGMAQFRAGQLTAALVHFTDAAALMPLRSPVRLQIDDRMVDEPNRASANSFFEGAVLKVLQMKVHVAIRYWDPTDRSVSFTPRCSWHLHMHLHIQAHVGPVRIISTIYVPSRLQPRMNVRQRSDPLRCCAPPDWRRRASAPGHHDGLAGQVTGGQGATADFRCSRQLQICRCCTGAGNPVDGVLQFGLRCRANEHQHTAGVRAFAAVCRSMLLLVDRPCTPG